MTVPVFRIGHATYETPDLDRQLDYYTQVIGLNLAGREKGRAILTSRLGFEILVLEQGSAARCSRQSFQVRPDFDFAGAQAGLKKHGIASERRSDASPGISEAVVFTDPNGTQIELFAKCAQAQGPEKVQGVAPLKLGHMAFFVKDAKAITDFYVDVLGFRVSDWMEDFFVFLRCGSDHHTANFRTAPDMVKLDHIAFELKDWAHIQAACEVLGNHKRPILWGPMRHGIGHNIAVYHRDPDDHIIEFYTELDQMTNEALGAFESRPWHRDRPQRPKVWDREDAGTIWGTPPAPDFRRGRAPMPPRKDGRPDH
jgi:catechol 2,3-dioxygenase-like lactoylglutathione lyase family enzyme